MVTWLRRLLGLRPTLRLYVQTGDELSEFVARVQRREAEQRGYRVRERRL